MSHSDFDGDRKKTQSAAFLTSCPDCHNLSLIMESAALDLHSQTIFDLVISWTSSEFLPGSCLGP
jgi:hypothetical protein